MRIRTKLLIFLLALVLPPLLVVSTYAVWESQNLGQKLADGAEESLVRTAKQRLQLSLAVMAFPCRRKRFSQAMSICPYGDGVHFVDTCGRRRKFPARFVFFEPRNESIRRRNLSLVLSFFSIGPSKEQAYERRSLWKYLGCSPAQ